MNLEYTDQELNEAATDLEFQLFQNDQACSESNSTLASESEEEIIINKPIPDNIDEWEQVMIKYN